MMTTIDTKTLNGKWGLKGQLHQSLRFLFIILLLWLFSSTILRGQTPTLPSVATSCDYATAPANMVLTVSNEPAGYTKTYLLVDMATGRIAQVNATAPSFTAVPQGNYYATAAYYHGTLVNAAADSLISMVYTDSLGQSACLIYAPSVALKVCSTSCDFVGTSVAINFTATASPTSGVTTTYVLIDETTNRVLQTNTTASFTSVPAGHYAVAAVYYNGSFAIAVGDTLYNKTTNDTLCVGVSNTLHYKVCTCVAGTTAPIITQTTASNTCPTTTVDLSTMTNTGTKPAGTTLIWSTHNPPTTAGDTLTSLAVSTAGKYYALYYDTLSKCYSPADSVTVTILGCPTPFTCTKKAYLFQNNPTDILELDMVTGVSTVVANDIFPATASVGFNAKDNYLWAYISALGTLRRVGSNWQYSTHSVAGLTGVYNNADIDANGILYMTVSNGTTIVRVDLNPSSPTYLTRLSDLSSTIPSMSDWASCATDNFLYSIDDAHVLYKFDKTTGVRTTIGTATGGGINAETTAFGALYMDDLCNLFAQNNGSGKIYKILNVSTGGTTAILVSTGSPTSFNDGARCATAPLNYTITGSAFMDNGAGGGTANNCIRDGSEINTPIPATLYAKLIPQGATSAIDVKPIVNGGFSMSVFTDGTFTIILDDNTNITDITATLPTTLTGTKTWTGTITSGVPSSALSYCLMTTCTTPSVGGTATYTGGAVCSTANMGTITLTGQTGDVVKWQTSTNGGTSWTDITNTAYKNSYTFINAVNNQKYRAIINTGGLNCVDSASTIITIATTGSCTTNTCSYTSGTFSPTISTSSNANYTTRVVLVNPTDGLIKYVTAANSTAFTGVAVGDYIMYAVTFDNTLAPQPTFTVGSNISTLDGCLAVSDPLLTKVCCPTIAAPITAVTQPTCSVATGTITVAPISGVTYSFDNGTTYQASNVKSGLTAGTYQVIVKDNTSGCASTAAPSVINAQPATPTISNIAKTDPSVASCPSLNDGTITVTATGSNLQYSKDNGATWQVSNSFTGLVAGSYTIKVKDNVSGCEVVYATNPVVLTAPTCVIAEICNNLIDDDGDGKIDCEDPDCGPCSCTTISNINYNAPTTNPSANHTRRYVLTNDNGVIQKVSTSPIFLGCPDGQYRVYTVWYIPATYTPPLSMGINISTVTGTSVVVSLPKLEKVCSPAVQYETRIVEKAYDCSNKKVTIQVQVRAKPGTGTFLMGDANYRFDYNSTQLTNPVIVSQEHFSSVAPASDANYFPQTLSGSSEGPTIGTVSLNTVYGGSGLAAQTVDANWQTVSCIQFDKRDTAFCYSFRWHDNLENPSTGMTGIVFNGGGAYDTYDVKSGGYYGNYQQCLNTLNCCTTLAIKVILEGPYNATTGLMSTVLNQRGLLPGQTPIGQFGLKTPDGQPFRTNPWNYTGTELVTSYPATVVDWVLVSLRTDSLLATSTILQKAGLLHSDGHVSFLDSCWSLPNGQKYFAVVEHRNHIGVMSNMAFTAQSNVVLDFTVGDGYIRTNPPTTGQKQVGSKWVMLAGDGRKELQVTNFDINFNDQQRWKVESGIFDQYNYSDFNLDADANFLDSNLWKKNNGRYSGVPH